MIVFINLFLSLFWNEHQLYRALQEFFSNYVLTWEYCIVISFLFSCTTWHMVSLRDLNWCFLYYLLCVLCCFILLWHGTILSVTVLFLCVTVFFCVIVLFTFTYFSVFFFLLCMYCFVFDCIYSTLTLPPGANPIAVNK